MPWLHSKSQVSLGYMRPCHACFFKLVGYMQDGSVSYRVEKNHTVGLHATCFVKRLKHR